jgi:hypothetical protein
MLGPIIIGVTLLLGSVITTASAVIAPAVFVVTAPVAAPVVAYKLNANLAPVTETEPKQEKENG